MTGRGLDPTAFRGAGEPRTRGVQGRGADRVHAADAHTQCARPGRGSSKGREQHRVHRAGGCVEVAGRGEATRTGVSPLVPSQCSGRRGSQLQVAWEKPGREGRAAWEAACHRLRVPLGRTLAARPQPGRGRHSGWLHRRQEPHSLEPTHVQPLLGSWCGFTTLVGGPPSAPCDPHFPHHRRGNQGSETPLLPPWGPGHRTSQRVTGSLFWS